MYVYYSISCIDVYVCSNLDRRRTYDTNRLGELYMLVDYPCHLTSVSSMCRPYIKTCEHLHLVISHWDCCTDYPNLRSHRIQVLRAVRRKWSREVCRSAHTRQCIDLLIIVSTAAFHLPAELGSVPSSIPSRWHGRTERELDVHNTGLFRIECVGGALNLFIHVSLYCNFMYKGLKYRVRWTQSPRPLYLKCFLSIPPSKLRGLFSHYALLSWALQRLVGAWRPPDVHVR